LEIRFAADAIVGPRVSGEDVDGASAGSAAIKGDSWIRNQGDSEIRPLQRDDPEKPPALPGEL
jgi:hypothetical protein